MSEVVSSKNNNKIDQKLCVKQHHKHIQSDIDKKARMKTNTPRLVTQFGPIWPTLGERAALYSTMMKVIQRGYKKLA